MFIQRVTDTLNRLKTIFFFFLLFLVYDSKRKKEEKQKKQSSDINLFNIYFYDEQFFFLSIVKNTLRNIENEIIWN